MVKIRLHCVALRCLMKKNYIVVDMAPDVGWCVVVSRAMKFPDVGLAHVWSQHSLMFVFQLSLLYVKVSRRGFEFIYI